MYSTQVLKYLSVFLVKPLHAKLFGKEPVETCSHSKTIVDNNMKGNLICLWRSPFSWQFLIALFDYAHCNHDPKESFGEV